MSYDIKAIRAALAAALQPLVDSEALLESSPYGLANPQTPCAMVTVGPTRFDEGGQTDVLTLTVAVLVGTASELDAQVNLDTFLGRGANSIKELIQADPTLGGACDEASVTAATGQRIYTLDTASGAATPPLLGCEWTVEVIT